MPQLPESEGLPEALLARCIQHYHEDGAAGVEALCRDHPEHAESIRRRMAALQRLGLLGEERESQAPSRIGPYRLLRRLGQGGMSVVHLARDERLGRDVALKLSHVPVAGNERARARFEREVAAVAQLTHPCIVPIFDAGEHEGRAYFTMEYVQGANLADVVEALRRGGRPLAELTGGDVRDAVLADVGRAPADIDGAETLGADGGTWGHTYVETVCRLVLDVADAVAHVHEHGIVHRDVKPSNVMVRPDGRAQLFDLGLARLEDQPALTRSGDLTGTPYYLAPEQVAGRSRDIDGRTDVYALGLTLFELLTLQRPFEGRGTAEVLERIQTEEPPLPRKLNPLVPRELEAICLTALEKDPRRRYATMEDMAADLRRLLASRPVRAQPAGASRRVGRWMSRHPALTAAYGLAVLILVGLPIGLLWANRAIRDEADRARRSAADAAYQAALSARKLDFLVDLFRLTEPGGGRGADVTAREVLDQGTERILTEFGDEPLVRASLLEATGRVYRNLGLFDRARSLLDRAFAIRQRELGESHPDVASVLHLLATVQLRLGASDVALALGRRALAAFEASGHGGDERAVECRLVVARAAEQLDDLALAERHLEQLLGAPAASERSAALQAEVRERLGRIAHRRGETALAVEHLTDALGLRRNTWSPEPAEIVRTLRALSEVYEAVGDRDLAERLEREARELERAPPPRPVDPYAPVALPFALVPSWKPSFDRRFRTGITALQSGRTAEAIEAFTDCLLWDPRDAVCAYNLACAHALSGRRDESVAWLERAAEWGIGFGSESLSDVRKDRDLDLLRDDARYEAVLERVSALRAAVDRFAAEPAVHLPAALATRDAWPLLVVLHRDGDTKHDVVDGEWRDVAERAGAALVAPSGRRPVTDTPSEGMAWISDLEDFLRRPPVYEEAIVEATRRFCEAHPVDPTRVYIAGEGLGGLLALDTALRSPGLFRGVVLRDAAMHDTSAWERAPSAAAVGLRVQVLLDRASDVPGLAPDVDLSDVGRQIERWLDASGLPGSVLVNDGRRPADLLSDMLLAMLSGEDPW